MIPRLLASLLLIFAAATAGAFDHVYDLPQPLSKGDSLECQMPAYPLELTINCRIDCPKLKGAREDRQELWTVYWNRTDPHSYMAAGVLRGCRAYGSPAEEEYIAVEIYSVADGMRQTLHRSEFTKGVSTGRGANSLDIDLYNRRLYLRIGNGNAYREVADIDFTPALQSTCGIKAHTDCRLRRFRVSATESDPPAYSHLDFAALDAYLRGPTLDPVEGYWYYHDRNIVPMKATTGGFYSLAIVKSPTVPGSYDIIYLSGAETAAESWQPLRIKGRIHPSGFDNEYDLLWYDVEGRPAAAENSAALDASGTMLTLSFPLVESQLRFRREVNQTLVERPE